VNYQGTPYTVDLRYRGCVDFSNEGESGVKMGSVRLGKMAFVPCVVYEAHLCEGLYLVAFDYSTTFPDMMEVGGMECPPSD
jgi:hypothetical protein